MHRVIAIVGLGFVAAATVSVASPTAAGADPTSDFLCNSGSAEFCAVPPEASPPSDSPEKTPEEESPDWESQLAAPENPFFPGCPIPGYPTFGYPLSPLCPTNPAYPACPPYEMYSMYSTNPFCPKPPLTHNNPFAPDNPFIPDYLE